MELRSKVEEFGEGFGADRAVEPERRFVTLRISCLAADALGEGHLEGADRRREVTVETAIRFYLRDKGSGVAAWPFPDFLRGSEVREEVDLRLGLDEKLWREFEAEAGRQGVSLEQLAEHAAFYLAAELEAGRITQRILEDDETSQPAGKGS